MLTGMEKSNGIHFRIPAANDTVCSRRRNVCISRIKDASETPLLQLPSSGVFRNVKERGRIFTFGLAYSLPLMMNFSLFVFFYFQGCGAMPLKYATAASDLH